MVEIPKIFERVDNMVYEREIGEGVRRLTEKSKQAQNDLHNEMIDNQMWFEIRRAAKTNIALQNILDHAIMIYKLSKEN